MPKINAIEPWLTVPGKPGSVYHPPGRPTPSDPGLGWITFVSYNFEGYDYDTFSFTCLLGDGPPEITDGYGGWTVVDRPRNVGYAQWNGRNPLTMKVPIMFDDWAGGDGIMIEANIRQLEKMAGAEINMKQPPLVVINSMGVVPHDTHDATQNDWVIQEIEWGDSDRNEHGNRVRQAATVTLLEFNYDAVIGGRGAAPSITSKKNAQKIANQRHYTVRQGDTLISIAHHIFKNSNYWRHIRDVNLTKSKKPRFTDPHASLPVNTIIILPKKPKKK